MISLSLYRSIVMEIGLWRLVVVLLLTNFHDDSVLFLISFSLYHRERQFINPSTGWMKPKNVSVVSEKRYLRTYTRLIVIVCTSANVMFLPHSTFISFMLAFAINFVLSHVTFVLQSFRTRCDCIFVKNSAVLAKIFSLLGVNEFCHAFCLSACAKV